MRVARILLFGLAGASLMALAACEEEKADTAPTDPPADVGEQSGGTQTDDTVKKLQDSADQAAEAIQQGANDLAEKGKAALEDAGPTLDKAKEIAKQVGESVDEIVRKGAADLKLAVDALNERIQESDNEGDPASDDPDTALSPADTLHADTRAAAKAGPAGVGPDYVGVWAGEAADCKRIDQDGSVQLFAVITPTTIRRYAGVCNFEATDMDGTKADIAASCIAEGATEDRDITLSMPDDDRLELSTGPDGAKTEYLRCHLPQ